MQEQTLYSMGEAGKQVELNNRLEEENVRLREKLVEWSKLMDEYEDYIQEIENRQRMTEYFYKRCNQQLKETERQNQYLRKVILSLSGNDEFRHLAPILMYSGNSRGYDDNYELVRMFNSSANYGKKKRKRKRESLSAWNGMMLEDYGMEEDDYGFCF